MITRGTISKVLGISLDHVNTILNQGSDHDIQTAFAPILREKAIDHLKNSKSNKIRNLRMDYQILFLSEQLPQAWRTWLKTQARDGAWATSLEIVALAELFDANLDVTFLVKKEEINSCRLYEASHHNRPTFHIYNSDNQHYHIASDYNSSIPDGNCFYNAFGQALFYATLSEENVSLNQEHKGDEPQENQNPRHPSPRLSNKQLVVYQEQQQILDKIQKNPPTPVTQKQLWVFFKQLTPCETSDHLVAIEEAHKMRGSKILTSQDALEEPNDPYKQIFTIQNALLKIMEKTQDLQKKAKSHQAYGHAAETAKALKNSLHASYEKYKSNVTQESYLTFKEECNDAISTARPELEKHRGWKEVFYNLGIAIAAFGVFYLPAICCNRIVNGRWFFSCKTDSAQKLDDLEKALSLSPKI